MPPGDKHFSTSPWHGGINRTWSLPENVTAQIDDVSPPNMAKKQHGKSASFLNTVEIVKSTDKFDPALDSSDDDAPEEVSFEDSKASALRSMRDALETAKR